MAKQQFLRQLLSGLQSGYARSEQAFYDRDAAETEFANEQEAARIKQGIEDQKLAEEQKIYNKESAIINTLLSGKSDGRKLTDQEKLNWQTDLSEEGLDRYEQLSKLQKKGNKYLQSGKYIYEVVDGILNPDPVNKIPEEPAKAKRVGTKYGIVEETGKPGMTLFYEDGTTKTIPSPLKDNKTTNGKGEVELITDYDPVKFKKFMDPFSRSKNRLVDLQKEYRESYVEEDRKQLRDEINEIAFDNEQTLLFAMPNDTKKYVQDFYDIMRENAAALNMSMEDLQNYNQEDLQKEFVSRMLEKKQKGEITSEQYRLLALWSKFKFGYLIESIENAKREKSNI